VLQFNTKGAFVGKIIESAALNSDNETILPHSSFIGTKLLPHIPMDSQFTKFTGHDYCDTPSPDKDNDLDCAIHTFFHFTFLHSKHTVLL
jgi:hypothetical protein